MFPKSNPTLTSIELEGRVWNFLQQNNIHPLHKYKFSAIFKEPKYLTSQDEVKNGFLQAFKIFPNKEPSLNEVILEIEKQMAIRKTDQYPTAGPDNYSKPRSKPGHS